MQIPLYSDGEEDTSTRRKKRREAMQGLCASSQTMIALVTLMEGTFEGRLSIRSRSKDLTLDDLRHEPKAADKVKSTGCGSMFKSPLHPGDHRNDKIFLHQID